MDLHPPLSSQHSDKLHTKDTMICNASWATVPQTFQQVAYIPVLLLGLLFNASAIVAFLLKCHKWTDTHIYMLNLALADSALVFFLPVRVYDAYSPLQPSNFCTAMISIHYVNMYASIFTVTCISVHRYLSIKFPIQAQRWSTKKGIAVLVCILIWVSVITICVLFSNNNAPDKLCMCYSRKDVSLSLSFLLVLEIVGYLLPLLTMTFFSIQTCCILQEHGSDQDSVQKKTFVRIVTANVIVFIVCYTPIHVAMAMVEYYRAYEGEWFSQEHLIHNFREAAEWIATTNCCLDSFGYYFLLRRCFQNAERNSASPDNSQNKCRQKYTCTFDLTDQS